MSSAVRRAAALRPMVCAAFGSVTSSESGISSATRSVHASGTRWSRCGRTTSVGASMSPSFSSIGSSRASRSTRAVRQGPASMKS